MHTIKTHHAKKQANNQCEQAKLRTSDLTKMQTPQTTHANKQTNRANEQLNNANKQTM